MNQKQEFHPKHKAPKITALLLVVLLGIQSAFPTGISAALADRSTNAPIGDSTPVENSIGVSSFAAGYQEVSIPEQGSTLSLVVNNKGSFNLKDSSRNNPEQFQRGWANGTVWFVDGKAYSTAYMDASDSTGQGGEPDNAKLGTLGYGTVELTSNGRGAITSWEKDGYTFKQKMTLEGRHIALNWEVINNSSSDINQVVLYHGGDVHVSDDGMGHVNYHQLQNSISIHNLPTDPMASLRSDLATPHSDYYGAYANGGRDKCITNQGLGKIIDQNHGDPGFFLQWKFPVKKGSSHKIYGQYSWATPGEVQVLAPQEERSTDGAKVNLNFSVMNLSASTKTIKLKATSQQGWFTRIYSNTDSITLDTKRDAVVTVEIITPNGQQYDGMTDLITLEVIDEQGNKAQESVPVVVDSSLPAITDIEMLEVTPSTVKGAVHYRNLAGEHHTTFEVWAADDQLLSSEEKIIPTGGIFGPTTVAGLVVGRDFFVWARVEGIPHPFERRVTIAALPEALSLRLNKEGPLTISENVDIRATIQPNTVSNRLIHWTASPEGIIEFSPTTDSGINNEIKPVSSGKVTLTAQADAAQYPSAQIEFIVEKPDDKGPKSTIKVMDKDGNSFTNPIEKNNIFAINTTDISLAITADDGDGSGVDTNRIYFNPTGARDVVGEVGSKGWELYKESGNNRMGYTAYDGDRIHFAAAAYDKAGNVGDKAYADDIVLIDTTAPTVKSIDIKAVRSVPTNQGVVLKITAEDPLPANPHPDNKAPKASGVHKIYYQVATTLPTFDPNDTTGWNEYNEAGENRVDLTEEKTHDVYVVVVDKAGNYSTVEKHGEDIQLDKTVPTITNIKLKDKGPFNQTSTTVKIEASDGVDGSGIEKIYYTVKKETDPAPTFDSNNPTGWLSYTENAPVSGKDGDQLLVYAVAKDKAGNVSEVKKGTDVVRIDMTKPQVINIALIKTRTLIPTNNNLTVGIQYNDPKVQNYASNVEKVYYQGATSKPEFSKDNTAGWTEYRPNEINTVTFSPEEEFSVYAVAVDHAGNISEIRISDDQGIVTTKKPTITVEDIYVTQEFNGVVTLPQKASAKDSFGNIIELNATHVDRTKVETDTVGKFEVHYTVEDSAGNIATATQYVYVLGEIEISANDVTIHKFDTQADFANIEKFQIQPKATIDIIDKNDGMKTIELDTHFTGTIKWGGPENSELTYYATYENPITNKTQKAEKKVTITITDENSPEGPSVIVSALSLLSIQGFDGNQLVTEAKLKENVKTSGGTMSYQIFDDKGTEKTLDEANATIHNYTVRYKVTGQKGINSYAEDTLKVIGEMKLSGQDDSIHVLQSRQQGKLLPEEEYTNHPVTAKFKEYENGKIVEKDGEVLTLKNNKIDTVGLFKVTHYGKYPIKYKTAAAAIGDQKLYVQGFPVVTANNIQILDEVQKGDIDPLTHPEIAFAAKINRVKENGEIEEITLTKDNAEVVLDTVPYGEKGKTGVYMISVKYKHDKIATEAETINRVDVLVTDQVDGAPVIDLNIEGGSYWQFIDAGSDLEKDTILSSINVTVETGETETSRTLDVKTLDNRNISFDEAITKPGVYHLVFHATDNKGRTSVAAADLNVVGAITITDGISIFYEEDKDKTLELDDYTGVNGLQQAEFVSYTGQSELAKVEPVTTNIKLTPIGRQEITYKVTYPDRYPAPNNFEKTAKKYLMVDGAPSVNTNETVEISIFDKTDSLNFLTDPRIDLQYSADKANTDLSNPALTVPVSKDDLKVEVYQDVKFGVEGEYPVVYIVSYTNESGLHRTRHDMTIKITKEGSSKGPNFELVNANENGILYFQTVTQNLDVLDYIKATENDVDIPKNKINVAYYDRQNKEISNPDFETMDPGKYKVVFSATSSTGDTSYFETPFVILGKIEFLVKNPIDTVVQPGGKLPENTFTGVNNLRAGFKISPTNFQEVAVEVESTEIDISTVGATKVTYVAQYPDVITTTAEEKAYRAKQERLVRVHGVPTFTYNSTDLQMRVETPLEEFTKGITAKVEIVTPDGSGTIEKEVPIGLISVIDRTKIQKSKVKVGAAYTLEAPYAPLKLSSTSEERTFTLHGKVSLTGNDVTLSTGFLKDKFESDGYPLMNINAQVDYYSDTDPKGYVTVDLTDKIVKPDFNSIQFGTVSENPLVFSVNDDTSKPAGLSPDSSNGTWKVHISDEVVGGIAPVITGTKPIHWLQGVSAEEKNLTDGVRGKDKDSIYLKVDLKITDKDGNPITIAEIGTSPTGTYTLEYKTRDVLGNTTVVKEPLYIHGSLVIDANSYKGTTIRTHGMPFSPNIDALKVTYFDAEQGKDVLLTSSHMSTDEYAYDASSVENSRNFSILLTHPRFNQSFTPPAGTVSTPTTATHTAKLTILGKIELFHYEQYDANETTRHKNSYNIVGKPLQAVDSHEVIASYKVKGGGREEAPVVVSAPKKDNSKPNTFTITYIGKETKVTGEPDVTQDILVEVDSPVIITSEKNPIIVDSDKTPNDVANIGGVKVVVYYGKNPNTPVVLDGFYRFDCGNSHTQEPGHKCGLIVEARDLKNTNNIGKETIPIEVETLPEIQLQTSPNLEILKGELTIKEIDEKIKAEAVIIDSSGNEVRLPAKNDMSKLDITQSGIYEVYSYYKDPTTGFVTTAETPTTIFVLNPAYIQYEKDYKFTVDKIEEVNDKFLSENIKAVGVGEFVDYNTRSIKTDTFAVSPRSTGVIKGKTFDITYDFSKYDMKTVNKYQPVGLSGTFAYKNQTVSGETKVLVEVAEDPGNGNGNGNGNNGNGNNGNGNGNGNGNNGGNSNPESSGGGSSNHGGSGSSGGTTRPDKTPPSNLPNQNGNNSEIPQSGNSGNQWNKDENGLTNESIHFWRATHQLLQKTKEDKARWEINSKDPKNPKQLDKTQKQVVAVPNKNLLMPGYVLNSLREDKQANLRIDMGDFVWYLDGTKQGKNSRNQYPLEVKKIYNREINQKIGYSTPNQQIAFGFAGGWDVHARLGVYISNKDLQGHVLYLYYFNPNTKELEFVDQMANIGSHWYSAEVFGLKGDYVITNQFYENAKIAQKLQNPSTGGEEFTQSYAKELLEKGLIEPPTATIVETKQSFRMAPIAAMVVVVILGVGVFVVTRRKRKNKQ